MTSQIRKLLLLTLLGGSAPLFAQESLVTGKSTPMLDASIQGKKDAFEAFKQGDKATGLGKLKAHLNKSPRALKEEVQINAQLVEISYWLANEQHHRALETALVAIDETEKSRVKLSRDEEAAALTAMGQLYEQVVGDTEKAKANYNAALTLNPRASTAEKGLVRLSILAATVDAKARENEAMRQRALNPVR